MSQHFRDVTFDVLPDCVRACVRLRPGEKHQVSWKTNVRFAQLGIEFLATRSKYMRLIYNDKWDLRYEPLWYKAGELVWTDAENSTYQVITGGAELMFPCDESIAEWDEEERVARAAL